MSNSGTTPILARARLRRDSPADALARLLIPEEPGARIGAAHSLVWALFADSPDRRRDFLWRETRPGEFLILASRTPVDAHNLFELECKPFTPVLHPGQNIGFTLRANPVVSVPEEPGQRGRRADIVMHALHKLTPGDRASARDAAIRETGAGWLARKGAAAGFVIQPEHVQIDSYENVRVPRQGQRAISFSTLTFEGVLTVDDPERFRASLITGFGAAKAFGCGLMLIRRAPR